MSNNDIIKIIYKSDIHKELALNAKKYNDRIRKGIYSFEGLEKYQDLFILLINLSNEKYKMTKNDQEILKRHNIDISPQSINQQQKNNKEKNRSFIAISDFHSYEYPLEKIKNYYINEYDIIYILGDATDRGKDHEGTGGIEILINIMKLSKQYPGRIIYIPGNHDEFLLGYIRSKYHMDDYYPYDYKINLIYNHGLSTIRELDRLERNDPKTFNELISWLERQPIQRTHRFNNKDYVLAHAQFNQKLYDLNPEYSLENYFKENQYSDTRRMANDVLWFRKAKNKYNPSEMPTADKIMVIGHTIEADIRGKNINLTDPNGRTIKVYCVDGGIAYNGGMLKYDGKENVMWTTPQFHNNTSNIVKKVVDYETIFKNHILNKTIKEGKDGFYQVIFDSNPKEINQSECTRIIDENIDSNITYDKQIKRSIYVKTVLFNHILKSQIERMQEQYSDKNYAIYVAAEMINIFLKGTKDIKYINANGHNGKYNYYNITSKNNAREIARVIGPQVMEELLYIYNYNSVEEYIYNKVLKNDDKKNNTKS